jgi:hypothetical protein
MDLLVGLMYAPASLNIQCGGNKLFPKLFSTTMDHLTVNCISDEQSQTAKKVKVEGNPPEKEYNMNLLGTEHQTEHRLLKITKLIVRRKGNLLDNTCVH